MNTKALFPELICTKLNRPQVVGRLVARPRLIQQLQPSLTVPLTLICAPAGFGKSTVVSAWVDAILADAPATDQPLRVAWLSLDEGDNDVSVFLRYLVSAVRTVYPTACATVVDFLRAPVQPAPDLIIAALINDLAELPSACVLILEDVHVISSEAVHDVLQGLAERGPLLFHLIMTSRSTPMLPLARMRARGYLHEVRVRDLRFTPDETAAFLQQTLPVPLSPAALDILIVRTEGWIAGLHLAALSLASASDAETAVTDLAGSDTFIAEYLIDEVLSRQTPEIRRFLLVTSALDRFCAGLADAMLSETGAPRDAQQAIEALEQANLFVIPLDGAREWYRYHALFKDLLLVRLQTEYTSGQIDELRRRAVGWFAQHGYMDEALQNALAAHDLDLAAHLMESALCDVLNRGDRPTLDRWLRWLPEEFIERRPALLLIKVWALELSWQLEAQKEVMNKIEAVLADGRETQATPDEQQLLRGQLAVLKAQAAYFSNRPYEAISYAQDVFALLPPSWMYVRGGAALYLGLAMQAIGQSVDAERLLTEQFAAIADKTNGYRIWLLWSLCFIHYMNGQYELLLRSASLLLTQAAQARLTSLTGWAHYFLGVVHYEWNSLDAARIQFKAVLEHRHVI